MEGAKFQVASGRNLQLWFLEVLCSETTSADNRYPPPRLSSAEEDRDGHSPSDLQIPATPTVGPNRENRYRLNFMAKLRPLRTYAISAPPRDLNKTIEVKETRMKGELDTRNKRHTGNKRHTRNKISYSFRHTLFLTFWTMIQGELHFCACRSVPVQCEPCRIHSLKPSGPLPSSECVCIALPNVFPPCACMVYGYNLVSEDGCLRMRNIWEVEMRRHSYI